MILVYNILAFHNTNAKLICVIYFCAKKFPSGRLASMRIVLDRRVVETPSRVIGRHSSDAYLSDDLPQGWERNFTEDDIPYYINHSKEVHANYFEHTVGV